LLIVLVVAPLASLAVACSRSPEQQFLSQFFRAARARDNTTLAMMSAASFDPREQGTVEDFEVTSVSVEERTPLDFKSLIEAHEKARAAEAEFAKRKKAYQDENLAAIEELIKLERAGKTPTSPAQIKLKAEWDKWREETSAYTKATSAARAAVSAQTGPIEASLAQPGLAPFDPAQFNGALVSKAVTVNAQVRSPQGDVAPKTMVVTMQRAEGTLNGESREGRWIISRIDGV
jgi:hypothetical protein